MAAILTTDQARQIGDSLLNTRQNAWTVMKNVAGADKDYGDEDWDLIKSVGNIFKCEECNTWQPISEKCGWRDDMCKECDDEQRGDEDDE